MKHPSTNYRSFIVGFLFSLAMLVFGGRLFYLHVINSAFLQQYGDQRSTVSVAEQAERGVLYDRNHNLIAMSTLVYSLGGDPAILLNSENTIEKIATELSMQPNHLFDYLQQHQNKQYVYLQRNVTPQQAIKIKQWNLPGIIVRDASRRFYPLSEIFSSITGFTNIDGKGQEGLERSFDQSLRGSSGKKIILRDRFGRQIQEVRSVRTSEDGSDFSLSIDMRLQYLAYRELVKTVAEHSATGGVVVIMQPKTGEILAMVSLPTFNPNNRATLGERYFRNRAAIDVFEPGSVLKPFVAVTALEQGYTSSSLVKTAPGHYFVSGKLISDSNNLGEITLSQIVQLSSNVGISKVALSLSAQDLWSNLDKFGFGRSTNSAFPWEAHGTLHSYDLWTPLDQATMSFGYGVSVTALQLARAYSALANEGILPSVSFLKKQPNSNQHDGIRVISPHIASQVVSMLEKVISPQGTGYRARISGYRVAGKTGTVRKIESTGYAQDRYLSLFVGIAPVHDPALVMVTIIDDPKKGHFYGGQIAAPLFAKVSSKALMLLGIPFEKKTSTYQMVASSDDIEVPHDK